MAKRLHVLSLSGGKDSVAAGLYLREQGVEHLRVFMDTGWEHPQLYGHLDYLEGVLGPIIRLQPKLPELPPEVLADVEAIEAIVGRSPSGFVRWTVKRGMFPSGRTRFCTQELKIKPFIRWVEQQDHPVISVVGIRAAESRARSLLPEWEYMPGQGDVKQWRPLLSWSEADVIAIHQRHGVEPCPLYLRGSTRVGCWPCIKANKSDVQMLSQDARRVLAVEMLEELMGRLAQARGSRAPTMFRDPFHRGAGPRLGAPIGRVVEWSNTSRGGQQFMLGAGWGHESSCVRWGMCEPSGDK